MTVGIVQQVRDRIECMRVRPLLQAWLDGQLDDEERAQVAAHLEACRRCGLAASTYRDLKTRLRGLGRSADPDAVARLRAFVNQLGDDPDEAGPPTAG